MILDLDLFKSVNDTHGHAAGDAVLKEAARRIAGAIRYVDRAARIGGEEFALILVQSDGGRPTRSRAGPYRSCQIPVSSVRAPPERDASAGSRSSLRTREASAH